MSAHSSQEQEAVTFDSSGAYVGSKYFDLHNFYLLERACVSSGANALVLELKAIPEFRERCPTETLKLFVIFKSLRISVEELPFAIEEIGYKTPGDADLNWLIPAGKHSSEDDLVLRLTGDGYVRASSIVVFGSCT